MNNCIICFGGQIASGKTTISQSIAVKLGWKYASFGNYVRYYVSNLGLNPLNRNILQIFGQRLIDEGWEIFCGKVLDFALWKPGESLVIDGVRHKEAIETIKYIVRPMPVVFIYINVIEEIRLKRIYSRGLSLDTIHREESTPIEEESKTSLIEFADLVIDGSLPIKEVVEEIEEWLSNSFPCESF
ncbi:MAG: AAA family ATPase [Bellilinea sp.]